MRLVGYAGPFVLLAFVSPGAALAAQAWSAPIRLDPGVALHAVACPSAGQCTAVGSGSGAEVTFDPSPVGPLNPIKIDPGNALVGIACPSVSQCTAVDNANAAQEVTFAPTFSPALPGPAAPASLSGESFLTGVACPSVDQCTFSDASGDVGTFDPIIAPGGQAPAVTGSVEIDTDDFNALGGIACPSPTQCSTGDQNGGEVTFNPIAKGGPRQPDNPTSVDAVGAYLNAIACPSTGQCTAVDDSGREVTFDPQRPGNPTPITIGPNSLNGVACSSTSYCVAVGGGGDAVEGDPAVGGGWTLVPISGAARLNGISCDPSGAVCVAVDSAGNAFVGPAASATGSEAEGTGFGKGHAQLSFRVAAAQNGLRLAKIAIALPHGLAFSSSAQSLAGRILVRAGGGKKLKHVARVSRGKLTITLKRAATDMLVTLSRPAFTVTKALANNIKHHNVTALQLSLTVTDTGGNATQIALESSA
jgi:hypothetical protein